MGHFTLLNYALTVLAAIGGTAGLPQHGHQTRNIRSAGRSSSTKSSLAIAESNESLLESREGHFLLRHEIHPLNPHGTAPPELSRGTLYTQAREVEIPHQHLSDEFEDLPHHQAGIEQFTRTSQSVSIKNVLRARENPSVDKKTYDPSVSISQISDGQIQVPTAPVSQTSDGQIQALIFPQNPSNRTVRHSIHPGSSPCTTNISMTDCRHSGTRSSSASLSGVISKHVGSSLSGLATGVLPYGTHTPLKPNAPARYLNSSHPGIISPTTLVSGYTNSIATFNSSHNTHRGSGTEPIPIATHSKEPVAIPYATALITITFTLHQPSSTLIYPPAVASSISRVAYSVGFSAAKSAAFLAMSLVNSSASATHAAVISTTTTVPSLLKNYTIDAPSAVAPTVLHAGSTSGLSAVQSDSSVAIPSMVANESLVRQTTDGPTQTFVPTSKVVSRVSEGMVQAPMSSEPASSEPPLSTPAPSKPAPSKPAPSKLASSTPASSTPAPSKPAMSKPAPSKSASSKPAPFKPTSPKPASSKLDLSTGLVSQIVDGQVQALTSSGSLTGQTSSGQAQGPTSAVHSSPAAVVSQLNDGQVQVPGSISVSVPFTPLPPLAGEALKGPLEASPTIVPAAPPAISSTGSPPAPSATQSPTASPAISVAASSAFPPAAPIVPPAAPSPAETVTETAPAPPATEAPVITETQTAIPPPSPDWNPEYTSSSSSSQGPVGSPPIIVPPGNGGESPSSDAHLDYELKNTVSLFGLVMIAALL